MNPKKGKGADIGRSSSTAGYRVCFPFVGDSLGGSHLSSLEMIIKLRELGVDVVIVLHQSGPVEEEVRRLGLDYRVLFISEMYRGVPRNVIDGVGLLFTILKLGFFCKKECIDIVHTNDGRAHVTWALTSLVFFLTHIWHQRTVLFKSRVVEFLLGRARTIICISQFVKQSIPPNLSSECVVIPNLVGNLRVDQTQSRMIRGQFVSDPTDIQKENLIGTFGNLTEIKDPLTIVHAFCLCFHKLQDRAVLCYFGEDRGNYHEQIHKVASGYGLEENVLFRDFQRPVAPWMSACDLVLAPSVCDAFGRTILEAMKLGVPVIAADAGGHRELIKNREDGLLVEPGNPNAMAAAIVRTLHDAQFRQTLIANGKKKMKSEYDPASIVPKIDTVYSRIAG